MGGFEKLPPCVLAEVLGWLLPRDWQSDLVPLFYQLRHMAERMWVGLMYNHEAMVRGRDALGWLGACRALRKDPLRTKTLVAQRELRNMFLTRRGAPIWELRALAITVSRMPPCQGRRHALEQSLLRPAARRGRGACDHHVAENAALQVESEPLSGEIDEFKLRVDAEAVPFVVLQLGAVEARGPRTWGDLGQELGIL